MATVKSYDLPLRWLRLPLLLATTGLAAVCIAVGVQAIRAYASLYYSTECLLITGPCRTLQLEDSLRAEALAQNADVKFNMQGLY